jgi:hypothetical protein
MNPFLASLFGQQVSSEIPETVGNPIDVERDRGMPTQAPMVPSMPGPGPMPENIQPSIYDNQVLGNNRAIQNRDRANREGAAVAEPRKGMFGVKGTLRDVLGLLGDAFLVQGGAQAQYMPRRERERDADRLAGASRDMRAAAERVMADNPALGMKMLEDAEKLDFENRRLDSLDSRRQTMNTKDQAKLVGDFTKFAGNVLYSDEMFDAATGNIKPEAYSLISNLAQSAGVDPEEFGITPDMNRDTSRQFALAAMPPKQQADIKRDLEKLEIDQQNAATRRASVEVQRYRANIAAKAAAVRANRLPTYASILDDMMKIPPAERTEDERNFIARYGAPTQGGAGRARPTFPGAPAEPVQPRFRPAGSGN